MFNVVLSSFVGAIIEGHEWKKKYNGIENEMA